jgi:hypothetical protein
VKTPNKKAYRLRNWSHYNAALVNRGSLTLWINEDIEELWLEKQSTGKPGASQKYTNKAIEICLSIRTLFHLPLRQTEGFVRSLLQLAGLASISNVSTLPVPNYSTLSRRQGDLSIDLPVKTSKAPRHIVLDSTGLKVYGEGEWKVRKHGKSKRRTWRKLHLSVDEATGEVLAAEMTGGDVADGPLLPELVQQSRNSAGRVRQASADGAYDSWDNDAFLTREGIISTIPPRKGSKIRQHGNCKSVPPLQRDENLRSIRKLGRRGWASASGYTRRCLAETQMMRQKVILGPQLHARNYANASTYLWTRRWNAVSAVRF